MSHTRRYDLDWLRVLVFLLLIFYHVGMYFVPWEWHLKDLQLYPQLKWPMRFINQWRLPILFVISGMGTAFALRKRTFKEFARERTFRLLIPLAAGILLVVPPQVYFERLSEGIEYNNYLQFLFTDAFKGVYPKGNFSWHHLWFLPYLYLFSLGLIPLLLFGKILPKQTRKRQTYAFPLLLIYLFAIPLMVIENTLAPKFPVTHALYNDWYVLPFYALLFFYGYGIARYFRAFWRITEEYRHLFLMAGIAFFTGYVAISQHPLHLSIYSQLLAIIKILNMWSWILCIFGFAARHLNKKSKLLSYCNQAVYPFYILHQTITVALGFYVQDKPWGFAAKFSFLSVGTILLTAILYEYFIRRMAILRPLFGLKPRKTKDKVTKPVRFFISSAKTG